jgi:hypothetical protein
VSRGESGAGGSLRVYETWRIGGRDLGALEVDLPVSLARRHQSVLVVFMHHGSDMGWHACVAGEGGSVLLSFPWTDHVDQILSGVDLTQLPVNVTDKGWDDLDQGWWGRVLVDGPDVYLAETDHDAIIDVTEPSRIEPSEPGMVLVDGVEVRWNVVTRRSYDKAWQEAVAACREGHPSPVGEWKSEDEYQVVLT